MQQDWSNGTTLWLNTFGITTLIAILYWSDTQHLQNKAFMQPFRFHTFGPLRRQYCPILEFTLLVHVLPWYKYRINMNKPNYMILIIYLEMRKEKIWKTDTSAALHTPELCVPGPKWACHCMCTLWPVLPTGFRTICTQPSTGLWFPDKCQHALTTSKLKWGMPPRVLDLWVSMMLKKKLHEPLTTKKAGETQWCGRPLSIKIPCSCRRLALWQTDPCYSYWAVNMYSIRDFLNEINFAGMWETVAISLWPTLETDQGSIQNINKEALTYRTRVSRFFTILHSCKAKWHERRWRACHPELSSARKLDGPKQASKRVL